MVLACNKIKIPNDLLAWPPAAASSFVLKLYICKSLNPNITGNYAICSAVHQAALLDAINNLR